MNYKITEVLLPAYNAIVKNGFITIPVHYIFLQSLTYCLKNQIDFKIDCNQNQYIQVTCIIIQTYCELYNLDLINSRFHIISELSTKNILITESDTTSNAINFCISRL